MKKVVKIALRVILVILFLQNIGFFSFISNLPEQRQAPQKTDGGERDVNFLNEKITKATQLGENYGPEEYFSDLTEIQSKEKNNDFDRRAVIHVSYTTNVLLGIFNTNVDNHRKLDSKKGYDNFMARLGSARDKCLNIIDPEGQKKLPNLRLKLVAQIIGEIL